VAPRSARNLVKGETWASMPLAASMNSACRGRGPKSEKESSAVIMVLQRGVVAWNGNAKF
jgi:hypothetical protein